MKSIRTLKLIGLCCLIAFILVSCAPIMPIYNGNYTIDLWNGQPVPYLNIIDKKIYNTSISMQYKIDRAVGSIPWTPCGGSVVDLLTVLQAGDQVWTQDPNISGSAHFLGTVQALSGRADLTPTGKVYPGQWDSQKLIWTDYPFGTAGQLFDINFTLNNIGNATVNTPYVVRFYMSSDRVITSSDTLIAEADLNIAPTAPVGLIPSTGGYVIKNVTVPALNPGQYYIGMIVDAGNAIAELNEDNNASTEDQVAEYYIRDPNANSGGAFKFVNSWGVGSWENVPDGHYWVTYDAMIATQMPIYYYYNTISPAYQPTVVAVFQISTNLYRNLVKITLALGTPGNTPFMEKEFTAESDGTLLGGGATDTFPSNEMTLDISEFAQYINDNNLYLETYNKGSTTGTLSNFRVEYYHKDDDTDYKKENPFKIVPYSGSNTIDNNATTDFPISTAGQLTNTSDIVSIQPNARAVSSGVTLVEEKPSEAELEHDMAIVGTAESSPPDNGRFGRYGLGFKAPSESEWRNALKLRSVQGSAARNTQVNQVVDHSIEPYFPPIGNQGSQNSCAAWAFGYYVHTYMMAKEYNWTDVITNTAHICSPAFISNQINKGQQYGTTSPFVAGGLLTRMGCAPLADTAYNQYDFTSWPSATAFHDAAHYRGRDTAKDYDNDEYQVGWFVIESDADINLLKNLIANGYCVMTAISVQGYPSYPDFFNNLDSNDVIDYVSGMGPPPAGDLDHAQTIVGFKDGTSWNKAHPDQ